jgi:Ca-activated chloride channel family protein
MKITSKVIPLPAIGRILLWCCCLVQIGCAVRESVKDEAAHPAAMAVPQPVAPAPPIAVATPDQELLQSMALLQSAAHAHESALSVSKSASILGVAPEFHRQAAAFNTESYDRVNENRFLPVLENPRSTFAIDVDTASYANIRRFINQGHLPPTDAVRIEEMINYFSYDYPQPTGDDPFSFTCELTESPWHPGNRLLMVGLQGKKVATESAPAANLVFLIDVSGSMQTPDKLPLLVKSFKLLVDQLRPQDRIAIIVYAGRSGLVLPSTSGNQKERIITVLNSLSAGGSTAGGEGIQLAYRVARENFIPGGNNRVILATDGDFNVGISSNAELEEMIAEKSRENIFLSVLGYGMGNYQDSKMQKLADRGNGNYAYIDNLQEARKVLVSQFGGTLLAIAKDVKLQLEFNPAQVQSYRLIGYEKRMLQTEDFRNDKKDAGELGSGHSVTALYEIVPANGTAAATSDLTYQTTHIKKNAGKSSELATIRFRYKKPEGDTSSELVRTIKNSTVPFASGSSNIRQAAAAAEWGMLLRSSEHKGSASYPHLIDIARKARGNDDLGYRAEFLRLVELAGSIGSR